MILHCKGRLGHCFHCIILCLRVGSTLFEDIMQGPIGSLPFIIFAHVLTCGKFPKEWQAASSWMAPLCTRLVHES